MMNYSSYTVWGEAQKNLLNFRIFERLLLPIHSSYCICWEMLKKKKIQFLRYDINATKRQQFLVQYNQLPTFPVNDLSA
jgi:hypothetical protein